MIIEWNNAFKQKIIDKRIFWIDTCRKSQGRYLKAYKIGRPGFERFVEERIFPYTVSFYDPIKQNKLKSFN